MAKPSSHAVVDSGEVPAAGGAAGDPSGFAAGEDGKWNLAEATLAAFPSRFPTLAAARKAVRRGEVAAAAADGARVAAARRLPALARLATRDSSARAQQRDAGPGPVPGGHAEAGRGVRRRPLRGGGQARARRDGGRAARVRVDRRAHGAVRDAAVRGHARRAGAAAARAQAGPGHGGCSSSPRRAWRPRSSAAPSKTESRASATAPRSAGGSATRRRRRKNVSGEDGEAGVALKTVDGAHPLSDRRVIDTPLSGKPCVTRWRVVRDAPCDTHERVTLVDMWPETGRKHQLRRHAVETLQAPILGDVRYARYAYGKEAAAKEDGLFLWAVELRVPVSAMPWLRSRPGTRRKAFREKK